MNQPTIETDMERRQRLADEAVAGLEASETAIRLAIRPMRPLRPYGWYNPDGRPLSADWKQQGHPAPVQFIP